MKVAWTLGVAIYVNERLDNDWLRSCRCGNCDHRFRGIAEVETVVSGLFAATQLAVLGIAAYTYDRTASLLAPDLAYAALLLANRAVVFVF